TPTAASSTATPPPAERARGGGGVAGPGPGPAPRGAGRAPAATPAPAAGAGPGGRGGRRAPRRDAVRRGDPAHVGDGRARVRGDLVGAPGRPRAGRRPARAPAGQQRAQTSRR